MSYKNTLYYKKIPKKTKLLINSYNDGKMSKIILVKLLNSHIKYDLKSSRTKYVRASELKGLLMKSFDFTYKEVEPFLPSKEDTKNYNVKVAGSLLTKIEMNINRKLLDELIKIPELYLMAASGRRYNELKEINYKDDNFYCCLSKTKDKDNKKIFIIGDKTHFKELLTNNKIRDIGLINKKIKLILDNYGFDISASSKVKKSTHLMRSIYINIISRYYNKSNSSLPIIAKRYLHKKGFSSVINYIYINFSRNFSLPDKLKNNDMKKKQRIKRGRTNKELREILNSKGINKINTIGFNRLTKVKLLELLNKKN